tara:strand:- start:766 stop:1179 length:414 start_codon:yes stop_codon:yes gene_type:complete
MEEKSNQKLDPLKDFSEEQIADLVQTYEDLEKEELRIIKEKKEEQRKAKDIKASTKAFNRLRRSPIEIINRLLFFIFIGSFLFSFVSVYAISKWWFCLYIISSFSCIFYAPNRKALKELLAAWPNIEDLIKNRSLWK